MMTCRTCSNLQCYVCFDTVRGYSHFDNSCPLYDDVEERHKREVTAAEIAARAQVVEGNSDVTLKRPDYIEPQIAIAYRDL